MCGLGHVSTTGQQFLFNGERAALRTLSLRSAGDRQFFFLNGRPVDLPKAIKLLNETYRSLSSPAATTSKPMAVVDFRWALGCGVEMGDLADVQAHCRGTGTTCAVRALYPQAAHEHL